MYSTAIADGRYGGASVPSAPLAEAKPLWQHEPAGNGMQLLRGTKSMKAVRTALLLSVCCLMFAATGAAAFAQGVKDKVQKGDYYQGISPNTPQCPAIRYLFRGIASNPIGYVWFADASGMSKATGTMDLSSGRFHLTLTSLDGVGPTGVVTGRKDPATGTVTAELDGPGCSKLKLGPTNPYVRKADGTD